MPPVIAEPAVLPAQTPNFADLGLPDSIVTALAERGVTDPFPIQAATIPDALSGKDILGRGRTGSGKTLSFGLPLLLTLANDGRGTLAKRPRGLILTPTRELAMQVADALDPYGRILGLEMKVVCGGTSMPRQIEALRRGVDVLVATPGRLRDLIDRKVCSLSEVSVAVLDEADQMADMGFLPEVTEILDQVPPGGQRMLFSATLEKEIDTLVKRYLSKPVTHEVDPPAGAVTTMSHHVLVVKPKAKAPVTAAIAGQDGRSIAFVRTQMGADRIAEQLREAGVRAEPLHGGMTQQARNAVLERFKGSGVECLVATDVAARGIHVDNVDVVLHVDPPRDGKDYLHRAGRTARAGRSGTVVTLALPHQRKTVFGMLERVNVAAGRHIVDGRFTEELAAVVGSLSLTDMEADSVEREARFAQREADDFVARAENLANRAAKLHAEAARLRDRAAKQPVGDVSTFDDDSDRPERHTRKPYRGQGGGGRRFEHRGDRRGGSESFGGRGRGQARRDDRGHARHDDRGHARHDERGNGRRDDRGDSRGGFGKNKPRWRDRNS